MTCTYFEVRALNAEGDMLDVDQFESKADAVEFVTRPRWTPDGCVAWVVECVEVTSCAGMLDRREYSTVHSTGDAAAIASYEHGQTLGGLWSPEDEGGAQ